MESPVPVVSISFGAPPTAAPDWSDVSATLRALTIRRGRSSPLEPFTTGAFTAVFDNSDRSLDPRNAAGPYYGNIKATRRIRFQVQWTGGVDDLGHGYVNGYPQHRDGYPEQYVEIGASDAFQVFGLTKLNTSFPEQSTSDRVDAVLDAIGFVTGQAWVLGDATFGELGTSTKLGPVGDRSLDAGVATCQAAVLAGVPALAHLQAVEATELGRLFVARTGGITFRNRTSLLLGGSGSYATFGDNPAGGELPYAGITLEDQSDAQIYNDVRVTPDGLTEQTAADATSQADHFVRTLARASLTPDEADAASVATYLLTQYKAGTSWVTGLQLNPYDGSDAVWQHLFQRDLGDVVTVRYTPLGGGSRVEQTSQIEGITLSWQMTEQGSVWAGEWALSPVDANAGNYWILGTGVLGTSTVLAL